MTKDEAIRLIGWLKCTTNREDDLEAIDMAIEALSADTVSREEYEELKAYTDTLVDAFIEDGEELAESVKVVRCKDCIHWKADNEVFELGFCCVFPQKWVAETFYCADGKRREE